MVLQSTNNLNIIGNNGTMQYGNLRLENGNSSSGRLEIFIDDTWGTICNYRFTLVDANVACRQLGYRDALAVVDPLL